MKTCTNCLTEKNLNLFPLDKTKPDGRHPRCCECKTAYDKEFYKKNKELIKNRTKTWAESNRVRSNESKTLWRKLHKEYYSMWTSNRRCKKLKATPSWLTKDDLKKIEQIYADCRKISISTGIQHEVDHIVPLKGKNVSGLHVPWNLQILTEKENNKKRAKF